MFSMRYFLSLGGKVVDQSRCVYRFVRDDLWVIIACHVDDCLLLSNSREFHDEIKESISKEFDLSRSGDVEKFLALHVARNDKGVTLNMQEPSMDMFNKFNPREITSLTTKEKPIPLPRTYKVKFRDAKSEPIEEIRKPYRILVGSAGYLAQKIRPDISFAHSTLSCCMHNPAEEDLITVVVYWSHYTG